MATGFSASLSLNTVPDFNTDHELEKRNLMLPPSFLVVLQYVQIREIVRFSVVLNPFLITASGTSMKESFLGLTANIPVAFTPPSSPYMYVMSRKSEHCLRGDNFAANEDGEDRKAKSS